MTETVTTDLLALATTLRHAINNAHLATLGRATEIARIYDERATNPRIGDLVTEATTIFGVRHKNGTDLDAVGILEEIASEGRGGMDEVFYIRTLDGRRFKWVNASMIAAVSEPTLLR
ncbi:hypothetical protein [Sphingomonas sp. YL-JM2C]